MQIRISRWALGVRLPHALARQVGIAEGQKVRVTAEGERLIVEAAAPRYSLDGMLRDMTPDAVKAAFDWGPEAGREIVDE